MKEGNRGGRRNVPPQRPPGPPPGPWPGPKPGPPQGPWPGPQLPVGQGAAVRVEGILPSERRELYIEDHFAGSSEAQGGPVSYQAAVEVEVGAGVIVWARRGEMRAVRVVGRRNLIVACVLYAVLGLSFFGVCVVEEQTKETTTTKSLLMLPTISSNTALELTYAAYKANRRHAGLPCSSHPPPPPPSWAPIIRRGPARERGRDRERLSRRSVSRVRLAWKTLLLVY